MDNVHNIEDSPWISKRSIKIREILKQWEAFGVKEREMDYGYEQQLLKEIDVERKKLLDGKLDEFINGNSSQVNAMFINSNTNDERCLKLDPECNLTTYKLQLISIKKALTNRTFKLRFMNSFKYTRQEILMRHLAFKPIRNLLETVRQERRKLYDSTAGCSTSKSPPHLDMVPHELTPEEPRNSSPKTNLLALLTVQIWSQPVKNLKPKLEKELLVRSDQTLVDIRSHFKCVRDYSIPMDLSQDPDTLDRVVSGELYKSGFFLIENTFYNDMRQSTSTDLSSVIIDWASKPERGIGPFYSEQMENTKFEDLTIRLGYPYLYQHQGDCEHLFTFTDIQFVDSLMMQQADQDIKYPLVTGTMLDKNGTKCYMCHKKTPHWFTRFNDRLPVDPFFFCQKCFQSFNYDDKNKKIGQFKAYPYIDVSFIPDSATM